MCTRPYTLYDMANRTDLLAALELEFQRRDIKTTVENKPHTWSRGMLPTLTTDADAEPADAYLGYVQVTVDTRGCYRWLDRYGHVRLAVSGDPADVADRIIRDRAATVDPPEPDMSNPPPPLPRRNAPGRRPTAAP